MAKNDLQNDRSCRDGITERCYLNTTFLSSFTVVVLNFTIPDRRNDIIFFQGLYTVSIHWKVHLHLRAKGLTGPGFSEKEAVTLMKSRINVVYERIRQSTAPD